MKHQAWLSSSTWPVIRAALRVLAASLIVPTAAQAVNIQVHTFDRNKPSTSAPIGSVAGFRYTIEADCTYAVDPNNPQPPGTGSSLSLAFHRSYMPVVATGEVPSGNVLTWTPPATARCASPESGGHGRYFVSVMPLAAGQVDPQTAFTMNGTSFRDDATTVTVPVYSGAIPTAQISVFVHDDSNP
ncbi:MAG: hypothetical protein KGJ44_08205, partial [Betaproteobacteria bacterium]|nr:hypothetical protein [Betaproteobacteria bacterium]